MQAAGCTDTAIRARTGNAREERKKKKQKQKEKKSNDGMMHTRPTTPFSGLDAPYGVILRCMDVISPMIAVLWGQGPLAQVLFKDGNLGKRWIIRYGESAKCTEE